MYTNIYRSNLSTHNDLLHVKCRDSVYGYGKAESVARFLVPDDKVLWSVDWPQYKPVYFEVEKLKYATWADPDIKNNQNSKLIQFNTLSEGINRVSYDGIYELDNGIPVNLHGRTGIIGRGRLGKWGPNHAADAVVTRWKRNKTGCIVIDNLSGKPILQFVAILRMHAREWAVPGGMVDIRESPAEALKREFAEEALGVTTSSAQERQAITDNINTLFQDGVLLYCGYMDDPRNTDNAWMETVALNFHDKDGTLFSKLDLKAGDDAVQLKWMDINKDMKLFASQLRFIMEVARLHDAHW